MSWILIWMASISFPNLVEIHPLVEDEVLSLCIPNEDVYYIFSSWTISCVLSRLLLALHLHLLENTASVSAPPGVYHLGCAPLSKNCFLNEQITHPFNHKGNNSLSHSNLLSLAALQINCKNRQFHVHQVLPRYPWCIFSFGLRSKEKKRKKNILHQKH